MLINQQKSDGGEAGRQVVGGQGAGRWAGEQPLAVRFWLTGCSHAMANRYSRPNFFHLQNEKNKPS